MRNQQTHRWLGGMACLALAVLAGCSSITAPGSTTATGTGTPVTSATGTPGTGTPGTGAANWGSILYDSATGRGTALTITNLNPASGNSNAVATIANSSQGAADGISPNGQLVAYHSLSGTTAAYSAANIANLSQPQSLGQVGSAVGAGVWEHDNAHLAVPGTGVITILSAGQAATTVSGIHAQQLIAFSSDDSSLFYVAAGDAINQAPGALYRLPLGNPSGAVQITPREFNTRFVLSPDGQTVYYNNTGASGTQGIYSVSAQNGGTPTLVRQNAGIPLGFDAGGALLYALPQSGGVALMKLNAGGSDVTLVANLVTGQGSIADPALDIIVAPDGSGVAALATVTGGFAIDFTDLSTSGAQPKVAAQLTGASKANLIGFDTALIAASS
jgi:hypothetical protein